MTDPTDLIQRLSERVRGFALEGLDRFALLDAQRFDEDLLRNRMVREASRILLSVSSPRTNSDYWVDLVDHATRLSLTTACIVEPRFVPFETLAARVLDRVNHKLRLPKNLAKGTWYTMTDGEIIACVVHEVGEFLQALSDGSENAAVLDEAVDVLDFCAMGADRNRPTDAEREVYHLERDDPIPGGVR
jgi:hypothetical protein